MTSVSYTPSTILSPEILSPTQPCEHRISVPAVLQFSCAAVPAHHLPYALRPSRPATVAPLLPQIARVIHDVHQFVQHVPHPSTLTPPNPADDDTAH